MVWLALLLALGTVLAIAYPLVRPRLRAEEPADDPVASELAAAKDSTYAAIKELEFDYRAGSLSRDDYQDLESRYKRKAAVLLQAEDAHQGEADRRAQIEAEVRSLRSQAANNQPLALRQAQGERSQFGPLMVSLSKGERHLDGPTGNQAGPTDQDSTRRQDLEQEIRRLRGLPTPAAEVPSPAIGSQAVAAARFCTQCGSLSGADHRFCAHCGHPLANIGRTA